MKVSTISQDSAENCKPRRNSFIEYSNSFMSFPTKQDSQKNVFEALNMIRPKKMGIENLEEFTIYPKEVKDGKMIITA